MQPCLFVRCAILTLVGRAPGFRTRLDTATRSKFLIGPGEERWEKNTAYACMQKWQNQNWGSGQFKEKFCLVKLSEVSRVAEKRIRFAKDMTSCQSEEHNYTMKLCAMKGEGLSRRISYSTRIFVPKACFGHLNLHDAVVAIEAIASDEECNELMTSPIEIQAAFGIALTSATTSTTTISTRITFAAITTASTTSVASTSTATTSSTTTSTTTSTSSTCACSGNESSDECVAAKIRCAWQNLLPGNSSNVSLYEYFSLFNPGREVISMKALIRCSEGTFGIEYDLINPITTGQSGVLYHALDNPHVLMKFPRMDVMDDMIGEVLLSKEFPDFVPRSTACVAKVTECIGTNAMGWPWRLIFNSDESPAPVYPILMKEKIVGMPMDKVLMTLCDRNFGTQGPPPNCPLSASFSQEDYNSVKALQPRRTSMLGAHWPRRDVIGADVLRDLMQILTELRNHCSSTGIATRDLKSANFVYGSQTSQTIIKSRMERDRRRLFLVDAVYLHEEKLEATDHRREQCHKIQGIVATSWNVFCHDCPHWAGIPEDDASDFFEAQLPHLQFSEREFAELYGSWK